MITWKKSAIFKFCLILIVLFKTFSWIMSFGTKHTLVKKVLYNREIQLTKRNEIPPKTFPCEGAANTSWNGSQCKKAKQDYLIKTPGCSIPNYIDKIKYFEPKDGGTRCGQRVVNLDYVPDSKIMFRMDRTIELGQHNLSCGYTELKNLRNDTKGILSRISPFKDGQVIHIPSETNIFVICSPIPTHQLKSQTQELPSPVYTDLHIILKSKREKKRTEDIRKRWNVLLLGVDYLSRGRVLKSMPKLTKYFKREGWLDFKAFHKVSHNNTIIPLLTGRKFDKKLCKNLGMCSLFFLWHKYKKSGYKTAMGQDVNYKSFMNEMARYNFTNHYFETSEISQRGKFMCFGQISTGEQLLNYALQFAQNYKKEKFFGLFWFSSYGRNDIGTVFQKALRTFFQSLQSKRLLSNTFVLLFGNQGLQFGPTLFSTEGYYDNKLPALFLWVPYNFRFVYPEKYKNLIANQNRLVTHYDLNAFLEKILEFSDNNLKIRAKTCQTCADMFEEISPERSCSDANIDEVICSCHNMTDLDSNADNLKQSLYLSLSEITRRMSAANYTTPLAACKPLTFGRVLRNHSYSIGDKSFFVTVGVFESEDMAFESVVEISEGYYRLVSLRAIMEVKSEINCVADNDPVKGFCICLYYSKEHSLY